jgi:cytochrome c biogenesis protein CcmG, thiol:disulfide interchange protein DsbE
MSEEHTPEQEVPEWLRRAAGEGDAAPVQQRISTFTIAAVIIVLGLLGIIGYALYQSHLKQPVSGPAPQFDVTVFKFDQLDQSGERIRRDDLKGSVVVLNFWASYCDPCKSEAEMLERVWQDYKDRGVVFLGVNTDDIESDARGYLTTYGITYPNAPDKGERMEDAYRITGIPETFIVDASGEITHHSEGEISESELRTEIEKALGKTS